MQVKFVERKKEKCGGNKKVNDLRLLVLEKMRFLKQEGKRSVARGKRKGCAGHCSVFVLPWGNLASIFVFSFYKVESFGLPSE